MNNVIHFPGIDERQWSKVSVEVARFLAHLGATEEESDTLCEKLRPRWERLGKPFKLTLKHSFPAPLTPEQLEAIDDALQAQVLAITDHYKTENAQTLLDFAALEFQLMRASFN